jgi:hypothetical protein
MQISMIETQNKVLESSYSTIWNLIPKSTNLRAAFKSYGLGRNALASNAVCILAIIAEF